MGFDKRDGILTCEPGSRVCGMGFMKLYDVEDNPALETGTCFAIPSS
jgi:hypothetical protein